MYAIFEDGGRQYRVEQGQELELDYRSAAAGETLRFDRVVAFSDGSSLRLGSPAIDGAVVSAEVLETVQGPKLIVQKFRRRKNRRRRTGHRQIHTKVRISKIEA